MTRDKIINWTKITDTSFVFSNPLQVDEFDFSKNLSEVECNFGTSTIDSITPTTPVDYGTKCYNYI